MDDTLLDFDVAENAALTRLFEQENITVTPEMLARYKEINEGLWRAFERGEVTKNVLHNTRFSKFFKEYGIDVDGEYFEGEFQKYLQEAHYYVEGAYEVIEQLAEEYDLYVVSNGKTITQNKRLADTCWFNIRDIDNTSDVHPHYEIKKLHELHTLLAK